MLNRTWIIGINEKFHTYLALKYINQLIELMKRLDIEAEEVIKLRLKLRNLLRESTLYKTKLVLEKVIEAKLSYESALLYGRLGDHERALTIFVRQLNDYKLAQQYCIELYSADNELKQRYQLFHTLLGIYLDINQRNGTELVSPALQLLNSGDTEFNTIKVLQLIPHKWTLSTIRQFLNKAILQSMHGLRQSLVTKGLATTENRIVKHERIVNERHNLVINEHTVCSLCKTALNEPQFIWYPRFQLLLHPHCSQSLTTDSTAKCCTK
ncbi:unnamed protein product [Medioppia subpectinata]|uniref:Vacuolar sorting protein 39/Transforming growth factor beta receptor-associated domain-containing protein n=1 Tax=Medioppia subpectinata TaxID=1979941 RepID=A0A7R9KSP4_9ACAR|nr:unnamed protein product [Medioppia subpectinata]CAG2109008.1 unnamed protein product [Medioppia subpectinata]